MDRNPLSCCNTLANINIAYAIAEALTVADLDSPGLSGVKEDQVEVRASEDVVGGAGGTDPSSLQRSLMHSWMPIMPKYVFVLP